MVPHDTLTPRVVSVKNSEGLAAPSGYNARTLWLALEISVWVAASFAVVVVAAYVSGHWFLVERYPDEVHYAETSDGWRLAVTRYRPERPGAAEPVLLVPGVAANRLHLDLADDISLARHLRAAGYDTWIVELRGRGLSTRPRLFNKYRYDWSFDEYVEKDLPAAVATVLRATGAERLHLVGVSLGGMIAYALLSDPRVAEKVRSAVTIAAPATFQFQGRYLFAWPLRNLRWLRHQFLMRLLAPLAGYWHPRPIRLMHHPENMSGAIMRRFLVNAAANFARNELLQFGDWIGKNQFRSIDHRRDYRKEMERIETPILLVAGSKDLLAPPPSVKDAYEAIGSTDKKLVIASRGQSFEAHYGHLDLVLGTSSPKEIHPLVRDWIAAHGEVQARGMAAAGAGRASS